MKVLKKAFDILELFLHNKKEMSLAEIAKLSGLNKTTVYRILSEMLAYGYMNQKEKGEKYSLGAKFFDFCGYIKANMGIRDICIPYLMNLVKTTNECSMIAIWDGKNAIITETFHSNHPLRVVPSEGSSISLHSTGPGKIILSSMSEITQDNYYSAAKLESFTPNTISDVQDLKKHITIIQRDGIAYDYEENHIGVNSVAVAIRDITGEVVGAIGLVGPSARFTRTAIKKSSSVLLEYAYDISKQLGYNPP